MPPTPTTLEAKVSVMEFQIGRIVSDIESEKETRARANEAIHRKLDSVTEGQNKTNWIVAMGVGGVMVVEVVLQFFHR